MYTNVNLCAKARVNCAVFIKVHCVEIKCNKNSELELVCVLFC